MTDGHWWPLVATGSCHFCPDQPCSYQIRRKICLLLQRCHDKSHHLETHQQVLACTASCTREQSGCSGPTPAAHRIAKRGLDRSCGYLPRSMQASAMLQSRSSLVAQCSLQQQPTAASQPARLCRMQRCSRPALAMRPSSSLQKAARLRGGRRALEIVATYPEPETEKER